MPVTHPHPICPCRLHRLHAPPRWSALSCPYCQAPAQEPSEEPDRPPKLPRYLDYRYPRHIRCWSCDRVLWSDQWHGDRVEVVSPEGIEQLRRTGLIGNAVADSSARLAAIQPVKRGR